MLTPYTGGPGTICIFPLSTGYPSLIRPSNLSVSLYAGTTYRYYPGYNNIDIEAARRRGITVCNVPTYSTDAVAHLVVTFMLNLSCSLVQLQRKLATGDSLGWRSLGTLPHFELGGKTVGLVGGRGTIGGRVADIALALGMKVLISSRGAGGPGGTDGSRPGVRIVDLATLLRDSDFVSIHCPLSASTRHLISTAELRAMKPTAYLINTARGPIVDEAALAAALKDGIIAGAGVSGEGGGRGAVTWDRHGCQAAGRRFLRSHSSSRMENPRQHTKNLFSRYTGITSLFHHPLQPMQLDVHEGEHCHIFKP